MRELAGDAIPVAVTCRVVKLARQPYYRWLNHPVTKRELIEAYRANALFDAHRDEPEFGHRLLADEALEAGELMADRTAWKITSVNHWWSVFGKKRGSNGKKPGPAVHDDHCEVTDAKGRKRHEFTADRANQLWLTDITEHKTREGKLYLCAVKDVYSNTIVGYSIDSRMKSRLAVQALANAIAMRGPVAGCVVHSDRGSQFRSRKFRRAMTKHHLVGSMGRVAACGDKRRHGIVLRTAPEECSRPRQLGNPTPATDPDHHLDRTDLPPAAQTSPTRPIDTSRIRGHHHHRSTKTNCHLNVQQSHWLCR